MLISLLDKGRDGRYTPREIADLVQQLIAATNAANVTRSRASTTSSPTTSRVRPRPP
jgi:hypothetical protein